MALAVLVVAAVAVAIAVVVQRDPQPSGATTRVLGEKFVPTANNGCGNGNGGGTKSACTDPKTFSLGGSVNGVLVPGAARTLSVVVSNTNNQDMQVTRVTGVVQTPTGGAANPSLPACAATWVSLASYVYAGGARIVAPAHGTVTVPLAISLTNQPVNQDNCKGATFRVALTGEGAQVQ